MKMATEENALITVAICTRNRAEFLEKAIRSVLPQLKPGTELIVIDNASTDETGALCKRLAGDNCRLTCYVESKLGLSAARNTAINKARGRYVLFLDDDAITEMGWIEAYWKFLERPLSRKIAAVGGAVVPFFDCEPPKWVSADIQFDRGDKPLLMPGGGISGCNSAYRREAAMAVGMFDEQLGYKGGALIPREESELQDRLIKAGWEIWWLPGAAVQHHVAIERLTVRGMAKYAFNSGRAAAIHRLKTCANIQQRFRLRMARLIAAPFQIIANSIQTLVLFALGKQAPAIGALCRVTRAAGWAWQIIKLR